MFVRCRLPRRHPDLLQVERGARAALRKGLRGLVKGEATFEHMKQSLASSPTLSYPDSTRPYDVVTDALDQAIGAVLLQDQGRGLQPIAYESRNFRGAELNFPIHDKESLAIIHAYKVWRCYLEGADSVIRTDHCSLRFLKSQPRLSRRQARWMEFMEGSFHYRIEYKPGVRNPADPLTRPSCRLASLTVTAGHPLLTALFEHGYTVDPDFTPQPPAGAEVQGSVYIWKGTARIWVPAYRPLQQLLLSEAHDVVSASHFGARKTAKTLSRTYFWPGLAADVEDYIRSCDTCQRTKSSRQRKAGLLQPIPPPDRPRQVVKMDFIMALPRTVRGHDAIFVVVDKFSRAAHFIPTHGQVTAEEAATLLVDKVVRLYGDSIISDRDPRFESKFWKQLFALFGTRLAMSSAYHPEIDGQTERVNQTLEQILRNITMRDATAWDKKLSMAEFAYNNTHHTDMPPFFALYGQHPNVPTRVDLTPTVPRADNFHQHLTFSRPHSPNLRLPQDNKLRPHFIGPFVIERALGLVAYHLRLPTHFRINPSFHVSLLRPYTDPNTTFSGCDRTPLPVAVDTDKPDYQIQRILRHVPFIDFLVRWRGYDAADDSWVPSSSLFPDNACLQAYLQSAGAADVASLGGG
ncbi:unnamed protein product [Closterium sp. Yama58-4]|nr:unnamed protein product [Closterium sp. Yama58-4]